MKTNVDLLEFQYNKGLWQCKKAQNYLFFQKYFFIRNVLCWLAQKKIFQFFFFFLNKNNLK